MTLTQTAVITKQIVIISIVVFVLGITGFIGYNIWHAYYLAHLPVVEEKPDNKFGLLPLPDFPQKDVASSNFSYSLDTTTGGLPKIGIDTGFEKIIRVYFVTQTFATLLSPEKSQALAEKFNISLLPEIISETQYRFRDADKTLLVDLNTGNFLYTAEATVSAGQRFDDINDDKLISGFKRILSDLGVLTEDIKNSRSKVIRLENQTAQISLWPASIDEKLVYTPEYNKALINATVVGSADKLEHYLSLQFTYYQIDTSTFATYFLKTPEAAFEDLKLGKGVVVVEPKNPQVSISSVSLGYFLAENYSPFLQPIYIFEGENFVAFVRATQN